ncbi:hypothetical protein AGOR_G00019280 [Albula goreensis]|uniref:HMG box domain-containing protein n=1 Tax=Albula goreensis TaxID=1534307 RepID=A0A8T3E3A6_9TELE|nr:hypothetical protein AGOR_G00019280 [Albula goreensis]
MGKGDPHKPKGRMSAYAYFVQTCREEHKKKNPEIPINFSEFSKKCSGRWKMMSDKEKSKFEDMAKQDKVRYEQEMKNYMPGNKREEEGPQCPQKTSLRLLPVLLRASAQNQGPEPQLGNRGCG